MKLFEFKQFKLINLGHGWNSEHGRNSDRFVILLLFLVKETRRSENDWHPWQPLVCNGLQSPNDLW